MPGDAEPLVIAEAGTESQGVLMADLDNSQTNHTTGMLIDVIALFLLI